MKNLLKTLCMWVFVANCYATEAPLVVPKFECALPAFKQSGDVTNEVRQLRKFERRYRGCVKRYKAKLLVQRNHMTHIQAQTADPTKQNDIQTALNIIDHILASDFKPKTNQPGPDLRDLGDPNHGG